jgi:predicted TPR repeat methyltransferase
MSSRGKLRPPRFPKRKPPPSHRERLTSAIQLHQKGQVEAAAAAYRDLLTSAPDDVDALHFLGIAEHQLGHPEQGLEHINHALTLAPNHLDAYNNRGNILKHLGRFDEAAADYRKALELGPRDPNALNNLGTVMRSCAKFPEAEALFREVIAIKPDHAPAWQNLGNTLSALDRFDEALNAHLEALRLAPDTPDSYKRVGEALYAVGRIAEAAEVYRRWLGLYPDDARARHYLASCSGQDAPARASDDFVREEFESFANHFDANLASLDYRAPSLVHEEVARLCGTPEGRLAVLDAGCGTGLCGPLLRPFARLLAGVDLSPAMVEKARQRGGYDALVVEELTAYLGRHEQTNDLIVSADTLVYFGDLTDVTVAAAGALRPDGRLVFTVESTDPTQAPGGYSLNPHGRYSHTADYLRRVLADAGFADGVLREVVLRKEVGKWVSGYLVSARRPRD